MRSKSRSKSTRGRDTRRIVGLQPLFICFITASLSSKMFNEVRMVINRTFGSTQSMSPDGSRCFRI